MKRFFLACGVALVFATSAFGAESTYIFQTPGVT